MYLVDLVVPVFLEPYHGHVPGWPCCTSVYMLKNQVSMLRCDFCMAVPPAYTCGSNEFTCDDGYCVQKDYVCDNQADCPDGSDEKDCRKFLSYQRSSDFVTFLVVLNKALTSAQVFLKMLKAWKRLLRHSLTQLSSDRLAEVTIVTSEQSSNISTSFSANTEC